MGIAAYNRGSRAISRYIDEQLRSARIVTLRPTPKPCDHLEARCKATRYGWNRNRWCPDCQAWFWHGDNRKQP